MRHLKRFESFTSIAADMYFSKNGDTFTEPNEYFKVEYCDILFPDDRRLSFKVLKEDYNSTQLNLKIGPIEEYDGTVRQLQDFYLSVYGDNIQFDSTNEYKFVRKYLTRLDLLDSSFDSYIYSDNHNGFFEITTHINDRVQFTGNAGILNSHNTNVILSVRNIVKSDTNWKKNIMTFVEDGGLYKSYTYLENILDDPDKPDNVCPKDIKVDYDHYDNVGISEIFYLYHILRGIRDKESLKKILIADHLKTDIGLILKIIGEIGI